MQKTLRDFDIVLRTESIGQHATTCPQCSPRRKNKQAQCLSVNVTSDATLWNCHHCGWTGSLHDGTTSKANPDGWKPDEYKRPKLTDERSWTEKSRRFFSDRKIGEDVLARNRITVRESVWIPQLEGFFPAILFPFFRRGECINIKYRGPQKNFRLETNAERIFYGLDDVVVDLGEGVLGTREHAFIVEGEMDKLAMEQCGYLNVLSTPNGAPPATAKNLDRYFDFIEASNITLNEGDKEGLLDRIETFYIAVDSDEHGQRLEEELIRRLGPDRCVRLRWPKHEGKQLKDANDVLIALGADGIRAAVQSAKPVPLSGVFTVSDFAPLVYEYYEKGLPPGFSTGWDAFKDASGKDIYTLMPGMLTLITGIPGHGKSTFIEDLTIHAAIQHDWSFAYFAPETQPLQLQAALLIEKYAGMPFASGYNQRIDIETLEKSMEFINSHYHFLLPEDEIFTIDDVLQRAEQLVRRHGVRGLVIDPWNNLHHSRPNGIREDEYIGGSLRKINQWKKKWNVWVCIAAHPYKMEPSRGKDPVPTPYNVKGGSEWFDMSDFCMAVWRNKLDETEPTEVHVQKVKFRHLGALGVASLNYDKPTGKFYDAGNHADTVKVKRLNADQSPMFSQDHIGDDTLPPEPYWMRD